MIKVNDFPNEFKHPFLRRYSLLMDIHILDVECDINGNWSVSDIETYEHIKKWNDLFNLRFVKASRRERTYSEELLDSSDYSFNLEKFSPFSL